MNAAIRAVRDGFHVELVPVEHGCRLQVSRDGFTRARTIDRVSILNDRWDLVSVEVDRLRHQVEASSRPVVNCPHCGYRLQDDTLCYRCGLDSGDEVSAENSPRRPVGATWQFDGGLWRLACGPEAYDDPDV